MVQRDSSAKVLFLSGCMCMILILLMFLSVWLFSPGYVVSKTEKTLSESTLEVGVGESIPFKTHISNNQNIKVDNYIFLGEKENIDKTVHSSVSAKKTIEVGKCISYDVKHYTPCEMQEFTILIERGDELKFIDTRKNGDKKYVKLYFEDVNDDVLKIISKEIEIEEKIGNEGFLKRTLK